MKPNYYDIIEKLGEPLWWDEHGVPRYTDFRPHLKSRIIADYVAFMEVACQDCGRVFKVAYSIDSRQYRLFYEREVQLPTPNDVGSFHYGDPPYHTEECIAGFCMLSIPVRILEFWAREKHCWVRKPEYEIEFEWGDEMEGKVKEGDEEERGA